MQVPTNAAYARTANVQAIEGPTRAQAVKLAARRQQLIADARAAETAGQDERAFDLDCAAWDIEMDLKRYGFNPETGRPSRSR